jgi:pimeloyl-ACP methyl ester carboxylesterase
LNGNGFEPEPSRTVGQSEAEARELENHFVQLFYAETFEEYLKHAKPLYDNPVHRGMEFVSALWDEKNWKPHSPDNEGFFDPMTIIETVSIPSLVFFGEKDTQVDPIQGMEAYEKAFQKDGIINQPMRSQTRGKYCLTKDHNK